MGMPRRPLTPLAASVVAPGLIQLGIPPLTAHFFIFYFAVDVGDHPRPWRLGGLCRGRRSQALTRCALPVESFKIGLAAFRGAVHVLLQQRAFDAGRMA